MLTQRGLYIGAVLALIAGIVLSYHALFFVTRISYSMGFAEGLGSAISAYGIKASNSTIAVIAEMQSLGIAMYVAYAILPFAIITLAAGVLWLFIRAYIRAVAVTVVLSSVVSALLIAILEFSLSFSEPVNVFEVSYIGSGIGIAAGIYVLAASGRRQVRKVAKDFEVNPETPFTNIQILSSRLMSKLSGDIKILDTHFDAVGLKNLARISSGHTGNYKSISVLTKPERLSNELSSAYYDFKRELENKGIAFELRVMSESDSIGQHERLIMDSAIAYKIPPLNIINKKSEHIVGVNHAEAERRFNELWERATKYENLKEKGGETT